eukprot:3450923-Pleurochrysis_carterae.AAC.1
MLMMHDFPAPVFPSRKRDGVIPSQDVCEHPSAEMSVGADPAVMSSRLAPGGMLEYLIQTAHGSQIA